MFSVPPFWMCWIHGACVVVMWLNWTRLANAQTSLELITGAESWNVEAVDFVGVSSLMTEKVNDIASWRDEEHEQTYLLEGCSNGTAFLKVLPGGKMLYMGKLPTQSVVSLWRDIKVLGNTMYVVSEASEHGMQVFNLEALREWSPSDGVAMWAADTVIAAPATAHNLAVNPMAGQVIQLGASGMSPGAVIFDGNDPGVPEIYGVAAEWGTFHDAHALRYAGPDVEHQGKDLLFAAGNQKLWILDVTDPTDIAEIAHATYPSPVFAHQVWVSDSHDHAFMGDELDESSSGSGTRTLVFDLTDLDAPWLAETYHSSVMATDHNQYTHGEWLFQSNYRAGLRMLSDGWPASPVLVERGFFDPDPLSNAPGFHGAWSHVILEELGLVAMSHIEQGVWMVRPEFARLTNVSITGCNAQGEGDPGFWSMVLHVEEGWSFPLTLELDGVELAEGESGTWIVQEPGSVMLTFFGWGVGGKQPQLIVNSQRSSWPLAILTDDALWPAHYADEDGDGYGNPDLPVWGCGEVMGTSSLPLDCQDWNVNTYPSAPELCDGWDNDCNGLMDEGTSQLAWYLDADGDGYGTSLVPPIWSCTALINRTLMPGDCNDGEATMYPNAEALAAGVDNNCDGIIDEAELSACMGDFNQDGQRSVSDMLQLLSYFGCDMGCVTSMNELDMVSIVDLLLYLSVFGTSCP
ncbi:MAG: choice-of-anchor B family protein [Bacteroidetes bacterium]|nr:choice-of-anchor B family protein [Bacteroidota bacterium]